MNVLTHFFFLHPFVYSYFLIINFATLVFYGSDKLFAIAGSWRVRERTLLLLALFGGSLGAFLGMWLFKHKTSKVSFKIWVGLIVVVQMVVVVLVANANGFLHF